MRMQKLFGTLTAIAAVSATPALADEIVIGFATAESGFMQAYDKPAQDAAMIRIKEINEAGGLLGKQIKVVNADTKTDQAEGAKAGLTVLDAGAELVIVSCDYDFGSGAALQAQAAGKVSFFLCAESIKAGIPGVGPILVLGLGARRGAGRDHGRMVVHEEERAQLLPAARHLDRLQQGHLRRLRLDDAAPEGRQAGRRGRVQERGRFDRLADQPHQGAAGRNPTPSCCAR